MQVDTAGPSVQQSTTAPLTSIDIEIKDRFTVDPEPTDQTVTGNSLDSHDFTL